MNRFRIDDSFGVDSVGFAFVGEVIEGGTAAGMTFKVPEEGHWWAMRVKAVEFVRLAGGKEKLGLIVEYDWHLRCLGVGWMAALIAPGETT